MLDNGHHSVLPAQHAARPTNTCINLTDSSLQFTRLTCTTHNRVSTKYIFELFNPRSEIIVDLLKCYGDAENLLMNQNAKREFCVFSFGAMAVVLQL